MFQVFAPHGTDFYKTGHVFQYPRNTQFVFSNFTPRSGERRNVPWGDGKVVLFGTSFVARNFLRDMWNETFFQVPKARAIDRFKRRMDRSLGAGAVDPYYMADLHDLQYLPLHAKTLPEGTLVPYRVAACSFRNTHPDFGWVTNYIESGFSADAWPLTTSATTARSFALLFKDRARVTGGPVPFAYYQGHDFSFRGMFGIMAAAISGAGHLTSFKGTDTIAAVDLLEEYYPPEDPNDPIGESVAATEHSVMCAGGPDDGEEATLLRLATEIYPKGPFSVVSDTWDFWHFIGVIARKLRLTIVAREGKVIFRPDSGDPVKILCGDPDAPAGSFAHKGAVEVLWDIFGGVLTPEGYRILSEKVGLIYGDSINYDRAERIMDGLIAKRFASCNVVLGLGSYTYQYVTRDTHGTATKATWCVVDGEARNLQKAPKTDSGVKNSARGLLRVEVDPSDPSNLVQYEEQTPEQEAGGLLGTMFLDGRCPPPPSITEVRARIERGTVW